MTSRADSVDVIAEAPAGTARAMGAEQPLTEIQSKWRARALSDIDNENPTDHATINSLVAALSDTGGAPHVRAPPRFLRAASVRHVRSHL